MSTLRPTVAINQRGKARVEAGHPWIFRSDIATASHASPGGIVEVRSGKQFIGLAFYNPRSQIALRFITRQREAIDREFWRRRLGESIARRNPQLGATRLVFAEADLLPGLIIDRYGEVIVFQILSAGMDHWQEMWLELITEFFQPRAIVERNDPASRALEGLSPHKGIVRGSLPASLEIEVGGKHLSVDPLDGHKTGLYLDQAENHLAAKRSSPGRVLDLFAYQGGFAIHLVDVADEVIAVESSAAALAIAKKNVELNQITNVALVEANTFDYLRAAEKRGEHFDTIILDPPPFASHKKDLSGAARGYKEINLRAMKLLPPGGTLITCSCSQHFSAELFSAMLRAAARDTHREIQIIEQRGAAPDHPVLLTFPESAYLQCWIVRII